MSIQQKIMQLQSDVVRLKKLVNYLMINNEKEINAESAYLFQAFFMKTQDKNGDVAYACLGLALVASQIATESEDEDGLEFTLVDLFNIGIKKTDVPRTSEEDGGIDFENLIKAPLPVTLINIYRIRESFLHLVQEKYSISKTSRIIDLNPSTGEYMVEKVPQEEYFVSDGALVFQSNIRRYESSEYYLEPSLGTVRISSPAAKPFIHNFFDDFDVEETGSEDSTKIRSGENASNYFVTTTTTITMTYFNLYIFFKGTTFSISNLSYISKTITEREYEPLVDYRPPIAPTTKEVTSFVSSPDSFFINNYYKSDDYLNFKVTT